MPLKVNAQVFAAAADGIVVFLDLDRDRYCALNRSWSARALEGDGAVQERLRRAGLCGGNDEKDLALTQYAAAHTGALLTSRMGLTAVASVVLRRAQAQRDLSVRPIASIVAERHVARQKPVEGGNVRETAERFCSAEMLVRREGDCLRRALALLKHLGPRASSVDWVFGVTGAPFSAHCWVQHGDTVLNDAIENTRIYTPIMIA